MNRRELLSGAALVASCGAASAFGLGKEGARGGMGRLGGLGKAGSPLPSVYTGQVATRTFIPNTFNTGNKQIMSRTLHKARDDITSLQLVIPNFYFNLLASPGSTEAGPGGTTTITASIEYPAATFTQAKFSGSNSVNPADNSMVTTDPIAVAIPNGATFFVRVWFANTAGIIFGLYSSSNALSTGDGVAFGATTPDLTMSGSVTQATNVVGVGPAAIIAQTRKASVYLLGDSRVFGLRDTGDSSGDLGELARSLGPTLAYIGGGCPGDRAVDFSTGSHATNRRALMAYASHLIMNLGINDVTAGNTPVNVLAAYQTIAGYFTGPKYSCTIAPQTTGAWTLANGSDQTVTANEANRVSLNGSHRSVLPNFLGSFEIANQVEAVQDGGKWKADGTVGKYTADGAHETQFANLGIVSSGAINPALFTR